MNKGSCLCGAVQFQLLSAPEGMSHCHCSICRKIHGTPFATYVHTSGVKWLSGEDKIKTYQSSENFHRCFCGDCGSVLPETIEGEDYTFVPAGTLDGDVAVRPGKHIFATSKADWYQIPDDLPQYESYNAEQGEGVPQTKHNVSKEGVVAGSCQCGDVTFQYINKAKFMMWCHCNRCRKVKGAAHAANVFVAPEDFTWTGGEDQVAVFNLEGAERFGNSFCKRCGSAMPRKADKNPLVNIPAGALDDAPGVETKGHIFVGSKADWFDISDDYEQFDAMP